MAMVGVDTGSLYRWTHSLSRLLLSQSAPAWHRSHSSNEPGEISQWLCHDDNTVNIVLDISIIIIIVNIIHISNIYYNKH